MGLRAVSLLLLGVTTVALPRPGFALETDQFTVPPRPLVDVGPGLDGYVLGVIEGVAREANGQAAWHERAARRAPWGFIKGHHRARAARFRDEDYLARRVFDALGRGGMFECPVELWVRRHPFAGEGPALFLPAPGDSVYGAAPAARRVLLSKMSPTVNAFGSYMGVDKLGHFFQQGHEYYHEYRRAESRGGGPGAALARAVRLGVRQERGFYGEATVGIYSNADLAANYAGLTFYLNLTRAVDVGGTPVPPVLVRADDGNWRLDPSRAADLLRPFFSDHFNEALNPCRYAGDLRGPVRDYLSDHREGAAAFFDGSAEWEPARERDLSTWHGADYGHADPAGRVSRPR